MVFSPSALAARQRTPNTLTRELTHRLDRDGITLFDERLIHEIVKE